MKFFTKEVKIALVAILAIVVLFFGMNFLKGISVFSDDETYYMDFQDVTGLVQSCPIYADGYKVGSVKEITYDLNHEHSTKVRVSITRGMRIPKGSTAEILTDLMGNVKIDLLLANNPRERMEPGETIPGSINAGMMGKAGDLIPAVEKMLPKLDSILTSLNTLLADPSIAQSLHNIQTITANLNTTTQGLNKMIAGVNGRLPGLMQKADGTLDNTQRFTANLADLDIQSTLAKVDATMANVKNVTDRLNSNQGTLGLLMNDASLYNNLNATVSNADSLMLDLRQHPKRYVHFSVFGKKDK